MADPTAAAYAGYTQQQQDYTNMEQQAQQQYGANGTPGFGAAQAGFGAVGAPGAFPSQSF